MNNLIVGWHDNPSCARAEFKFWHGASSHSAFGRSSSTLQNDRDRDLRAQPQMVVVPAGSLR
jgi:hypothetical protein